MDDQQYKEIDKHLRRAQLWLLVATVGILLALGGIIAKAAGAQTVTLWPKEVVVNMGWHTFQGGDPLARNNKQLEGEQTQALESSGIEAGWVQTMSLDHYSIPQGKKVISATVHYFGAAGEPLMPGKVEVNLKEISYEGLTHAKSSIEGFLGAWNKATWTFTNPPFIEEGKFEGWCPDESWATYKKPGCVTRQQQLDNMLLQVQVLKYAPHDRIFEAYVQLDVEP